jgi:hypothetical protein
VLIHCTTSEVLSLAKKRGYKTVGERTYSSMLGAYQFIQNLGRGDLDVRRLGTSVFIVVVVPQCNP